MLITASVTRLREPTYKVVILAVRSYSYVKDGDKDLKTFSVAHDEKYKIPLIKEAIAAAGGKLTLFASPWSPPAFMKDNKDMLHGGKLLPA